MSAIKLAEVSFIQGMHKLTYAPNGKYVVILKDQSLKVIGFEQSSNGSLSQYSLNDKTLSINSRYKIACFEDYLVYVQISSDEQILSLLRFDFKSAATFRIDLPFSIQTEENDKIPQNAAKIFKSAYIYFEDIQLRQIFDVNSIILELSKYDFQIIGDQNRLLLPYRLQKASPFTQPFIIKQRDYMNVIVIKSWLYKAGRITKTRSLFQGNRYDYHYLSQHMFILSTPSEVKIFQKQKMIRKFVSDKLELVQKDLNYVLAKEVDTTSEFTFKFDISTGKRFVIARYHDVIIRGRYLFCTILKDDRPTPYIGLDQDGQYALKEYFIQILKVYKFK